MTVGEQIQFYRKRHKLSQEELGQKLLVSRQTISLWETGQTLPTIDNLIRLKEIFGCSVDELLCGGEQTDEGLPTPKECYRFQYSEEEIKESCQYGMRKARKNLAVFLLIASVLWIGWLLWGDDVGVFILFGFLLYGGIAQVRLFLDYRKQAAIAMERMKNRTYEYELYEDCFKAVIWENEEQIRTFQLFYSEIEKIYESRSVILLQASGQLFTLRKADLAEDSLIFTFVKENPTKYEKEARYDKWAIIALILFVATLIPFGVNVCWDMMGGPSSSNPYVWFYFLLLPVCICSIVVGGVLISKKRGKEGIKNVIVGAIAAVLVLGQLVSFLLEPLFYDHDLEYLLKVEEYVDVDFPEHSSIRTLDWTKGTQSVSRGYVYYVSTVGFNQKAVEQWEKDLSADGRWIEILPSELVGLSSSVARTTFDYCLLYNMDLQEFNSVPAQSGTYRMLQISYRVDDNEIEIVEYDIEYIE